MFGYTNFLDKSMNGVRVLSDGITTISNGNITNVNNLSCEIISANNIQSLETEISTNKDEINEINNTKIPNLQSQITLNNTNLINNVNNINDINNVKIPLLQSQITTVNNNVSNNFYNKQQVDSKDTTLQSQIITINNNVINNYYTKTQINNQITSNNNNFYNKNSIDYKIDVLQTEITNNNISIDELQSEITNNLTSIQTNYYNKLDIDNKNLLLNNKIISIENNYYDKIQVNTSLNTLQTEITNNLSSIESIENNYINNITVGTVTTSSIPSASIIKIGNDAIINFGLVQGIQGIQGTSFNYKGQWNDNDNTRQPYFINDVCTWEGSSYICIINTDEDINPKDNNNKWSIMSEKGDRGEKGSTGESSDFSSALGIIGGVGAIFGAVAISAMTFANQFQNMKNKLGDISDEIDDIPENNDYRISILENKTQFIETIPSSVKTIFNSNIAIQDILTNDVLSFDRNTKTLKTDIIEVNTLNSNGNAYVAETLSVIGDANIGTHTSLINGSNVNIKGLNINIGSFGTTTSLVNINGVIFINGTLFYDENGFFNQL